MKGPRACPWRWPSQDILPNAEVLDFAVLVEEVGAGEEAAG